MLDYCYQVNPYFNRSAIIKEMQDFFPVLGSEYPSGMGVNSGLASECWGIKQEHIVVGNGDAVQQIARTKTFQQKYVTAFGSATKQSLDVIAKELKI